MDSLALLCTLHADGPATLARLRRCGCHNLSDLQRLGVESLAEALEVPPAMARRLVREAQILRQRVGSEPLDPEEAPEGMVVSPIEEPAGPVTQASPLDRSDFALIREVMNGTSVGGRNTGFRTYDEELPGDEDGDDEEYDEAPWFAPDNATASQAPAPRTAQIPPAFAPPTPDAYALAGAVDGLDRVVAQALAGAGVTSLRDLVEHDAGSLARATGINFSRIRRLQFLARREESAPRLKRSEPTPGYVSEPLPPREPQPAPQFELRSAPIVPTTPLPRPVAPSAEVEPIEREWFAATGEIAPVRRPGAEPLPDHPVRELEPESAGPMAMGEEAARDVAPLGRWMPRAARGVQDQPIEAESGEPVLVPPPPPRRFWEPKRIWEARMARREKAARKEIEERAQTIGETENLMAGSESAPQPSPRATPQPQQPKPVPSQPAPAPDGALQWDFSVPELPELPPSSGMRSLNGAPAASTKDEASGPFA